jgi:hypothetical protein
MKLWKVILANSYRIVEAETREEAKKIAGEQCYWVSQEWLDKLNAGRTEHKYRIIVREHKKLYGWDLINSLGSSKYN